MGRQIDRRDIMRAGLVTMVSPLALGWAAPPAREVRAFRLAETGGLRRFGYPVHAIVPDASDGENFRLLRNGRAIPAQFRKAKQSNGDVVVHLDFNASLDPLEVVRYQVLFGRQVDPGPEPRSGLTLQEFDDHFLVTHGDMTRFDISRSATELLRAVGSARLSYLDEPASRLRVDSKGTPNSPIAAELASTKLEVSRHGPMAVGFRSVNDGPEPSQLEMELTIPSSKSWIEIVVTAQDPTGIIKALEFDLNLQIEGSPTLIDLGAGSTVYGQIKGAEMMELVAGQVAGEGDPLPESGWVVRKGDPSDLPVLARSAAQSPRDAEGWAHIMDARRCSAIALANFGKSGARDRMVVQADGHAQIVREYAVAEVDPVRGPKSMTLWLHFVPMPVQIGAATSPQSMLAPLRVIWDRDPNTPDERS